MSSFFRRRKPGTETRGPISSARVGHFYLDVRRRLLHGLNDTARQFLKEGVPIAAEDLAQQPLHTLCGDPVTANDLPLVRAWREGTPQSATFVLPRPGGAVHHLNWNAAPLRDADEEVVAVVGTLSIAAPEPDWQALGGLAHDLRTPLQALKLLVPLAEGVDGLPADARDLLQRIRSSADRALAIGDELLQWCRSPTQGPAPVTRSWFDLASLLEGLAVEQFSGARRKGIELTTDLAAAGGLEVHSDPVRLGRLLSNLLTNAIRYTSAGQVLFKAAFREAPTGNGKTLVLSVVDTGPGISQEEQESIFQPFERGRAGKESDSGGSGLGLAVVDRLVEELGLTLEVFSEYGHGSAFDLLLPPVCLRPAAGKVDS
jgi:signal transduction histidine kinase